MRIPGWLAVGWTAMMPACIVAPDAAETLTDTGSADGGVDSDGAMPVDAGAAGGSPDLSRPIRSWDAEPMFPDAAPALPDAAPALADAALALADAALALPDAAPPPDAAPVLPDAAPVLPDAAPPPDAAPVLPDGAPVLPDAALALPDAAPPPFERSPTPPAPFEWPVEADGAVHWSSAAEAVDVGMRFSDDTDWDTGAPVGVLEMGGAYFFAEGGHPLPPFADPCPRAPTPFENPPAHAIRLTPPAEQPNCLAAEAPFQGDWVRPPVVGEALGDLPKCGTCGNGGCPAPGALRPGLIPRLPPIDCLVEEAPAPPDPSFLAAYASEVVCGGQGRPTILRSGGSAARYEYDPAGHIVAFSVIGEWDRFEFRWSLDPQGVVRGYEVVIAYPFYSLFTTQTVTLDAGGQEISVEGESRDGDSGENDNRQSVCGTGTPENPDVRTTWDGTCNDCNFHHFGEYGLSWSVDSCGRPISAVTYSRRTDSFGGGGNDDHEDSEQWAYVSNHADGRPVCGNTRDGGTTTAGYYGRDGELVASGQLWRDAWGLDPDCGSDLITFEERRTFCAVEDVAP